MRLMLVRTIYILFIINCLSACGQSGKLYLPEHDSQKNVHSA